MTEGGVTVSFWPGCALALGAIVNALAKAADPATKARDASEAERREDRLGVFAFVISVWRSAEGALSFHAIHMQIRAR